jgi:hypothetical protein
MISDLDETIRKVLVEAGGFKPSEVEVSFEIPNREWSTGIARPTLNCYLFDIRENRELRQHGMSQVSQGGNGIYRQRPAMRFDLTYLVTAWTAAVEDEHRLLWHALHTLTRFETIPAEYLQGDLLASDGPIFARTALPESILKSPGEFWTALENQIKPSLSYVVTVGLPRDAIPAGPPVLSTAVRFPWPGGADERWVWFGGTVRDPSGRPVGGALVEIERHGLRTVADAEGRFRLRVPGSGRYQLSARFGTFVDRREIDIPDMHYDISLGDVTATT